MLFKPIRKKRNSLLFNNKTVLVDNNSNHNNARTIKTSKFRHDGKIDGNIGQGFGEKVTV